MLPSFHWILPGRRAAMSAPHPGAAPTLRALGIGAVLTLTERAPLTELSAAGLAVHHEPVADFTAPDGPTLQRCVAFVRERWAAGDAVAVHCHAGLGRTGTVVAAVLVAEGVAADEAIARVRRVRPGSVETWEQEAAVRAFASRRTGGEGR